MKYKFQKVRLNYLELSSGSVILSFPGQPAFPIRLSSEIFLRCVAELKSKGEHGPYSVFDPLCGGGYLITCLAYLHSSDISEIYCSDINSRAISTTEINLSLLTYAGLNERITQLQTLYRNFRKDSHKTAIKSAEYIYEHYLSDYLNSIPKTVFEFNALSSFKDQKTIPLKSIDIVITDLPYGIQTKWVNGDGELPTDNITNKLLESLTPLIKQTSVIALVGEKIDKKNLIDYSMISHFKIGHRHISLIKLNTK